jgi:CRISPR/Cas system CSM-associated protein Csm2 small subunit
MNPKLLPLLGVVGVICGAGLGWFGHSVLNTPEVITPPPEIIKEEISDEDLATLCEELTEDERANILDVQAQVVSLQSELQEKESELDRLYEESKRDASKKEAARKRWKELEAEIATLRVQIASVERERDELKEDLQETLVKLDSQIRETKRYRKKAKKYRRESTQNLWTAFVSQAKVNGCNKGTKKRHEKCWDAFEASMAPAIRERFTTCVNTYQAVPILSKSKKGEALPQFAEWLSDETKYTRNWYILFCDPSLPERGDPDLDGPSRSSGRSVGLEDLGLDDDDPSLPEAGGSGGPRGGDLMDVEDLGLDD